ncbi:MoaF-related domain-containing protein [Gymnodinialimonas sp.]
MSGGSTAVDVTHEDLVGASFQFLYSDETYRIDILSEARLRWTRVAGDNVGQSDEEAYVFDTLSPEIILVTWIEADGLGLSNALNVVDGTLITHANHGREVFQNMGRHSFKVG